VLNAVFLSMNANFDETARVPAVLVVSPAATGRVGEPGDVACFGGEWRRRAVEMATNRNVV
jgi:hypothetical protein